MYYKYDKDDIYSLAWCAVITAYHKYPRYKDMICIKDFLHTYISDEISEYKKQKNRFNYIDFHLALDKPYGDSGQPLSQIIPNKNGRFENHIVLLCFLKSLGKQKFEICKDYMAGYTDSEIISKNNLSKDEFNIIKEQLKIDLIDFIN